MPNFIARNARLPQGLIGHLVAIGMQSQTLPANKRAVELLDIHPGDTVLDIGCGNGSALRLAVDRGATRAVGVDPSVVMRKRAHALSKAYIHKGSIEILQGEAARLTDIGDGTISKAMTIHTIYFWPEPLSALREIRRTLMPAGFLLIGMHPSEDSAFLDKVPSEYYQLRFISEVIALGKESGFSEVETVHEEVDGIAWLKMWKSPSDWRPS